MSTTPPTSLTLWRDRSFWALNATQFLGAFNDNLFKELVLLLCVAYAQRTHQEDRYQALATTLFSVPFILFSGFAGYLSDRFSKRTAIIACKVAEVVIVLCGMVALATGELWGPLAVLCLMGMHSAFFGPPKYGILPEMLRGTDLPRANGMMLMITFLAIIFGLSGAGAAIHYGELWGAQLWHLSVPCVIVAVIGVITAFGIRPLPAAEPNLRFEPSALFMTPETMRLLWNDRELRGVLGISSAFWFVAGVIYPQATNAFGKLQLGMDNLRTGALAACTGIGIAIGCVVAGGLSKDRIRGWVVRVGAYGLAASLAVIAVPGSALGNTLLGSRGSAVALMAVGFFAGFFSVPLQVYLQAKAPSGQKGRIVAAMNLVNWIGIAGSGVVYGICAAIVKQFHLPQATTFAFCAVFMLIIAGVYTPPDCAIETPSEDAA